MRPLLGLGLGLGLGVRAVCPLLGNAAIKSQIAKQRLKQSRKSIAAEFQVAKVPAMLPAAPPPHPTSPCAPSLLQDENFSERSGGDRAVVSRTANALGLAGICGSRGMLGGERGTQRKFVAGGESWLAHVRLCCAPSPPCQN